MELGSEFNFNYENTQRCDDNIFLYLNKYNTIYTNSGRSALLLLQSIIKKGKILFPSYTCTSILDCYKNNYDIEYYNINSDLSVDIQSLYDQIDNTTSAIYIQNYFGATVSNELIETLHRIKSIYNLVIIEDTTHSIFTRPISCGDYCICSLRKWFSITDGGVLYSKNSLSLINLSYIKKWNSTEKLHAMMLKTIFLEDKVDTNSLYRFLYMKAENQLDSAQVPYLLSDFSEYILHCCSIQSMISIRKNNYYFLHSNIKNNNINIMLPYDDSICPYTMVVRVPERDYFRSYLMQQKIYCAVHWPIDNRLQQFSTSVELSNNILSLPIDQRYSQKEMKYLVDSINAYQAFII